MDQGPKARIGRTWVTLDLLILAWDPVFDANRWDHALVLLTSDEDQ